LAIIRNDFPMMFPPAATWTRAVGLRGRIVYINDYYNIHEAPKKRNYKYLVRMYWMPSVMDLIYQVSQLLRAELEELVDVAQTTMEPIKPCDEEW